MYFIYVNVRFDIDINKNKNKKRIPHIKQYISVIKYQITQYYLCLPCVCVYIIPEAICKNSINKIRISVIKNKCISILSVKACVFYNILYLN